MPFSSSRWLCGLVLIGLASAAAAKETPMSYGAIQPKIAALIQSRWAERQKQDRDHLPGDRPFPDGPSWSARVSPPFPAAWPPDGKGRLVVYGYAAGMSRSLSDGEQMAAPWGRVLVDGDALAFEDLGDLRGIGVQGVRPLYGEELQIARSAAAAADELYALARGTQVGDAPVVKRFYRQWLRDSGAGDPIRRLHKKFAAWVGR